MTTNGREPQLETGKRQLARKIIHLARNVFGLGAVRDVSPFYSRKLIFQVQRKCPHCVNGRGGNGDICWLCKGTQWYDDPDLRIVITEE